MKRTYPRKPLNLIKGVFLISPDLSCIGGRLFVIGERAITMKGNAASFRSWHSRRFPFCFFSDLEIGFLIYIFSSKGFPFPHDPLESASGTSKVIFLFLGMCHQSLFLTKTQLFFSSSHFLNKSPPGPSRRLNLTRPLKVQVIHACLLWQVERSPEASLLLRMRPFLPSLWPYRR